MNVFFISAGWFCSDECQEGHKDIDHVLEHNLALLQELVLIAINHDYVREGDGEGMIRMWKFQNLQFWNRHNYKYVIAGHYLLASK